MTCRRLICALVLATVPMAAPTSSWATTCSEWRATCRGTVINNKHDPKICDAAYTKCMKSGHWIGPDTGRDYGPADRR